ncbi:hypothetical protein FHG87_005633 [Trinorchestia longiramus]|nr:hypothetical protein FHG87_005633 [Trinorchestia longiramus]
MCDIPFDKTIQNVVTPQAHTSAYVDTEKEKKLVFWTCQLELLLQKQFSMNDYCSALQSYPKCNYEQLRDLLVLPCKRKLQYITSSIEKDQVLRETFDKIQTLQLKNVFLLVDEVQIPPTVSFSGGVLSGMAENNRHCKATSILITSTSAKQLELHLLNNCILNNWISEKDQKISLDNETTASFADVKELYESKKGSILTTTTLTQFAVNSSNLLSTPQKKTSRRMQSFFRPLSRGPALVGIAAVLLPFFFCCAVLKVGNLANDGYRLGTHDGACSKDPPPIPSPKGGIWMHGGPIAPFLHLMLSHALLMAKMILETTAVQQNFLPQDHVWRSELSAFLPERERLSRFWLLVNHAFTPVHGHEPPGLQNSSMDAFDPPYTVPDFVIPDAPTPSIDLLEDRNGTGTGMVRGRDGSDLWHVGGVPWGPVSPHLVNYIIAHVVYAGRYAGVFWGTNKAFGLLMFVQLLINCLHNIFSLNGYQILYKARSVDPDRVLAHLEGFIMTVPVTVAVFTITQLLVLLSGCILYHYGWTKFQHFIASEKEKYHIMSKHGYEVRCGYLPHGLALLWVLFTTASTAPLLHDWVIVYTASYDTAVLAATLTCLMHILLWVLLWMALTLKSWWVFKVRVQISQATVAGPHSIRLVNEVQLTGQLEGPNSPLLVVGAGKTYLIQDQDPKRALMKTVMGAVAEKKAAGQEDEIYWVMPQSLQQQMQEQQQQQHQAQIREKTRAKLNREGTASKHKTKRHSRRSEHRSQDATDSDQTNESESEYARLRDVSFPGPSRRSAASNVAPTTEMRGGEGRLDKEESNNDGEDFPIPPPECAESLIHCPFPPTPPPPLPPPLEEPEQHPSLRRQHQHSLHKHHNHHQQEMEPDQPPPPPPLLQQPPPPQSPNYQLHKPNQPSPHEPMQQQIFQQKQQQLQQHHPKQHQQMSMINRSASPPVSAAHPKIKTVKGDSLEASPDRPDCSPSPASSVTPPDKRCDSGIHSQASTSSSSGTHSKSGSSGSEDCVPVQPPAMQPLHIQSVGLSAALPPPAPANPPPPPTDPPPPSTSLARCASVDDLCTGSNSPPPPAPTSAKTLSLQRNQSPPPDERSKKLNIEVVGGGYGFLPPSKFVSSEPIYSDASTPVVIRRRSSITAIEPDTPPYERSAGSFSTFTEPLPALPSLPRCLTRGNSGGSHMLAAANSFPGRGIYARGLGLQKMENKHATIAATGATNSIKGFHHPDQVDPRYFSVPSARAPTGTRVHPAPPSHLPPQTSIHRTPSLH